MLQIVSKHNYCTIASVSEMQDQMVNPKLPSQSSMVNNNTTNYLDYIRKVHTKLKTGIWKVKANVGKIRGAYKPIQSNMDRKNQSKKLENWNFLLDQIKF